MKAGHNSSTQKLIERWVRPEVRALSAYHVPDAGDLIKLDAMENPYCLPPELVDDWLERLRGAHLNRYPDPTARRLAERLRTAMGVPDGAALVLGNGSDELIQMILLTLAGADRYVLAPEPSFAMYRMIASFVGMRYEGVPLRDDFSLDLPAMLDVMRLRDPAVVFLAYPNNPTGNLFDEEAMRVILGASSGLVVIDEAYTPFSGASFLPMLGNGKWENLLILRTVSKLGLAGLRLGVLAGSTGWLGEIDKVRLPYNINVLTQLSAEFALAHMPVFEAQAARIREGRAWLLEQMRRLPGLHVYPSDANFVLFRTPPGTASALWADLKAAGVLVKNLDGPGALQDCLRVTVGTPQENQAFLAALIALLPS